MIFLNSWMLNDHTDDDQIATSIAIRFRLPGSVHDLPRSLSLSALPADSNERSQALHENTIEGKRATCAQLSGGAIDCVACIFDATSNFVATLTADDTNIANLILETVRSASVKGMRKSDILVGAESPHS
jgi:hypothetical protein